MITRFSSALYQSTFQFAETAVLEIHNDIPTSMDNEGCTLKDRGIP